MHHYNVAIVDWVPLCKGCTGKIGILHESQKVIIPCIMVEAGQRGKHHALHHTDDIIPLHHTP